MKSNNATQLMNVKIDSVVKESAETVLTGMGLNMSAYVGMCLRQLAQDRKLPFVVSTDPDFWILEEQAAESARIIKSGFVDDVRDASYYSLDQKIELSKVADDATEEEILTHFLFAFDVLDDHPDIISMASEGLYLKSLLKDKADYSHEYFDELLSLVESRIDGLFAGSKIIEDYLDKPAEQYSFTEKIDVLEYIKGRLFDTIECNKNGLRARFVGPNEDTSLLIRAENWFDNSAKAEENRDFHKNMERASDVSSEFIVNRDAK
ncbi:type II toxin-antitoxin system RelB/DinJ family antitoxin [Adlercreutzia sp. ZJ242]|uniref:type II toxin-antitoxin system RelB/DinJ family antitoxin n=1 Tax=Adlercreutzia sp. ZJ242 TaxID=2709409 RepID=UPI0013EA3FD0|nr:type II toxin-antitoxin system RelB/DinJ family antitoxin [Adlercreutzia sp. ZJ242]